MVVQSVGCAIERICILTTCLPRVAAPMPNARKRAAKWVAISRSDLRTRGLLMHLIAQNVGCALGRIRIVTIACPASPPRWRMLTCARPCGPRFRELLHVTMNSKYIWLCKMSAARVGAQMCLRCDRPAALPRWRSSLAGVAASVIRSWTRLRPPEL